MESRKAKQQYRRSKRSVLRISSRQRHGLETYSVFDQVQVWAMGIVVRGGHLFWSRNAGGSPDAIADRWAGGSGNIQSTSFSAEELELADFVSVVLTDTEDTWDELFQPMGRVYKHPGPVLFKDSVGSACGSAQAAMGPFYFPADRKVYIDLSFYHDLQIRFGAPGDFSQAYVIAHEVGHHVQNFHEYNKSFRNKC